MKARFACLAAFVILLPILSSGTSQTPSVIPSRAFVDQYCGGCHNDRIKAGGFSWSSIDLSEPSRHAEQLEKVIRQLNAGTMPPAGIARPDARAVRSFTSGLEAAIDQAVQGKPYAGAPALHRLNRTEYRNAVRDLLHLDVDIARLLPPDDPSHGFDNIADSLSVTPALVHGYVRAAATVSRMAVGDVKTAPTTTMYSVPRTVNQMRHIEGTPFGTRGGLAVVHDFPADGDYVFNLKLFFDYLGSLFGQNLPPNIQGQQIEVSIDGSRAAVFTINPNLPETENKIVSGPIRIGAGPHRLAAAFVARFDGPTEDQFRQVEQSMVDASAGVPGLVALPHLQTLSIVGPYNPSGVAKTPSRQKVFICTPGERQDDVGCATAIIGTLARQAFRRPLLQAELDLLLKNYRDGYAEGGFDSGVRAAIEAILTNPKFLFRLERQPADAVQDTYRLSDLELATRLAFFLWSSLPDEQLLSVAAEGKLHDPAVLERETHRMLADRKATALVDNFAAEWLRLPALEETSPDGLLFPNFTHNLAESMLQETKLLFASIMREDRSITELLTADYTFVDETLARHYGIPSVRGSNFRRIRLTDPTRFGLLGQASILTITSLANRTSPVARGKYVLEVFLGIQPPAPPPNVPPLMENLGNEKAMSVRDRMEAHRRVEPCASCHKLMDPIGIALENFDAVGLWRNTDSGSKIDASGQLYDGTKLDGPVSLRNAILNRSDAFLTAFTERLMEYGTGRLLNYQDMPAVRAIRHTAARNDNRFSALVIGIVNSPEFQLRQRHGEVAEK